MNKKFVMLITFVSGLYLLMHAMYKHSDMYPLSQEKNYLVNQQGCPSSALLQLLSLTDIKHDNSLRSIVEQTQKPESGWLRKEGLERWEIVDQSVEHKEQYFQLFHELNLIDEIRPKHQNYDYLLLMGATYLRIKSRLEYAISLWNQGVRFHQVVILAGARPLTDIEKEALVKDYQFENDQLPGTEGELMQYVYRSMAMPEDMKKISTVFINAPLKLNQHGILVRPTTGDTVNSWMDLHPDQGTCLVISNQPYVGYQDAVVKTLLPQGFLIETVGLKSEDNTIGIYLDTLARTLYQEKIRLQMH